MVIMKYHLIPLNGAEDNKTFFLRALMIVEEEVHGIGNWVQNITHAGCVVYIFLSHTHDPTKNVKVNLYIQIYVYTYIDAK